MISSIPGYRILNEKPTYNEFLVECPDAVNAYNEGDEITLNVDNGEIVVAAKTFAFPKLPKEILAIRDAGGLLAYTRTKLKKK